MALVSVFSQYFNCLPAVVLELDTDQPEVLARAGDASVDTVCALLGTGPTRNAGLAG